MDFAKHHNHENVPRQSSPRVAAQVQENLYKKCLLTSVWTQSRLVASLLEQVGLTYHRVFDNQALELFLILINTELPICYSLDNFTVESLSVLNHNLLMIQSKLISSMDLFVVETLKNSQQQKKNTPIFSRFLGKHRDWELCAKSRFEQVVCSILERKLIKNNN